jgi:hypothetical protein
MAAFEKIPAAGKDSCVSSSPSPELPGLGLNPTRENTVIVLEGPPRSGKSCLRQALKGAISQMPEARDLGVYPYVITACPDGEGAWFQETAADDPDLARRLKDEYKSKFTPDFVARIATSVEKVQLPLVLVDVGGITSEENERICATATHAVLLSATPERMEEWRTFNRKVGLVPIAEIVSDYHGTSDTVHTVGADQILKGSVHHLERGERLAEREMVKALARHIVELVKRRMSKEEIVQGCDPHEMSVPVTTEVILARVEALANSWQQKLGKQAKVVLGGSLVSDTFVPEGAKVIDADIRFLVKDPSDPSLIPLIEGVTGLTYRKTIEVGDWPSGKSTAHMIEGALTVEGVPLPIEVEGCLRNESYVGWHSYYQQVFTAEELAHFRQQKRECRDEKERYKALKFAMREECVRRAVTQGLVSSEKVRHSD